MVLKLLLLTHWASFCSGLSSIRVCDVSSNTGDNGVHVNCHGRGLTGIPKDFPANTTSIDLTNNLISSVTNHSFQGITRLQSLELTSNIILSIEPLAFWNCGSLKTLSIINNKVCVNGNVFETLWDLQELAIDDCYAAEVLKPLSHVTKIDIKVNYNCTFKGFHYLTNLRTLGIQGIFNCQNNTFIKLKTHYIQSLIITANIAKMGLNALAPLKYLKELIFSNTKTGLSKPLDSLYALAGRNLTTLVLDGARSRGGSRNLKEVKDRTLTKEKIKYLANTCVNNFSAKNNRILYFDIEFIMNSPIGKCLKNVNLQQNMINTLRAPVFFQLHKVKQLEYLDFSYQAQMPVILPKNANNLTLSKFSNWESLQKINGMFITIPCNFKELNLRRGAQNMGHMDFDVFIRNGQRVQKVDASFTGLTIMRNVYGMSDIDYIDLSGNDQLILPDDFFCSCKKIKTLKLSDMSVRQQQIDTQGKNLLQCLPKLRVLDISGNRLVQLPSDLFHHNPLLEYLDLSRNIFISIPVHLSLLPNLNILDVSLNNFGSLDMKTCINIDTHYQKTKKVFQLLLEGNFFECSCTNFPFLYWLSETEVLARTKDNLSCITENGIITNTGEMTLNLLKFWRKCNGGKTFSISLVLGTVILCCILLALLIDTNKTKLAYMLINAIKYQAPKRKRKDFTRDVFVSYADTDYHWACHELCGILEERDLSLFIWDRDAVPGDCTAEVITENVNQCWKTILFFTENYEEDAWGYLTTMAAINCVDNLNPERLILLLPENENPRVPECLLQVVPETCIFHVPREVRRNDAFWDELVRAIKREY